MAMMTLFHVEKLSHGTRSPLYLEHIYGQPEMEWTRGYERAFDYENEDEANDDAEKYGGEVCEFQRSMPDRHRAPSLFLAAAE